MPMIDVVVPDDVVFVEIGARLNFNDKGGDLAWISQTVPLADGDVGRLVLAQNLYVLIPCHLYCTADHDPMLRAVMMALQSKLSSGFTMMHFTW